MEWVIGLIILWVLGSIFGGSKDTDSSSNTPTRKPEISKRVDRHQPIKKQNEKKQFTKETLRELAKKHPHLNKNQPTKKTYTKASDRIENDELNNLLNEIDLKKDTSRDYKDNWKNFEKILLNYTITHLYHFTDQANIPSIKRMGGLYSWKELENLKVRIPAQGGSDFSKQLDTHKGLENYVRLSFVEKTPMLYVAQKDGRIKKPVLLKIDPSVIFLKNSMYSDGNATANRAQIGGELNDFERINFDIISKGRWEGDDEKHFWQAEVMVRKFIPLKYIKNLSL